MEQLIGHTRRSPSASVSPFSAASLTAGFDRFLSDDERILWVGAPVRRSRLSLARLLGLVIPTGVAIVPVVVLALGWLGLAPPGLAVPFMPFALACAAICVGQLTVARRWRRTTIALTTSRLLLVESVVPPRARSFDRTSLTDVELVASSACGENGSLCFRSCSQNPHGRNPQPLNLSDVEDVAALFRRLHAPRGSRTPSYGQP